jgi:hypothetical protein
MTSREETCWHCGGSGRYRLPLQPHQVTADAPPLWASTTLHVVEIDCWTCHGRGLVEVKDEPT